MAFIEQLRKARLRIGKTQQQIADELGVTKSTYCGYETGKRQPDVQKIKHLAKILNTSPDVLLETAFTSNETKKDPFEDLWDKVGISPISKKQLPILGNAACGEPTFAEQNFQGYVSVDADIPADFCLYAKGDSMVNARIHNGDIVFVRKQDIVDDGEIAVVLVEDDTTIKRVYYDRDNGTLTLVPENPAFKVMRYHGEQLNQIRILGKVIAGQYNVE